MNHYITKIAWGLHRRLSRLLDKSEVDEYISGIEKSISKLSNQQKLTAEQKREISEYYEKVLKSEVPTQWHEYFTARLGVFDKKYIPTSIYKTDIIGRLNIYPLKRAYTDKNITDLILPNAHQPHIYLKNMNGYYTFEGKPVTKEGAAELCKDLGPVIIKPSLTARGEGVRKLNIVNGKVLSTGENLIDVLTKYGKDFLIEDLVEQHEQMNVLNPSSVNTIRIVTYRSGMDIKIVYTVIRIGRAGQEVDNESAGGISAKINSDGTIAKYAYGAPGVDKVEYTDTGAKLEGFVVPSYKEALDFVKEQHYNLPYFNIVGWDIAIEKDGKPIVIEFNMTPDLSQSANGPAFGDLTEEIFAEAMKYNNTYSRISQRSMWMRR